MNELQIFKNQEFGQVRTITEDGKTLFCGKDTTVALGYKDSTNAMKQHCRGVVKRHLTDSLGRKQETNFIPEGDIYRLAAKSELPGAERFESWVFDEVLPTIRATGAYMTPETIEKVLYNPDTIINLAEQIKALQGKNKALAATNEMQQQIIGELKPKADYVDLILSSLDTMTVTQIAADYGMSAQKLNKILHEECIQRKVGGQWILYREHMGKGYTKSNTFDFTRSDGRSDVKQNTEWTQKGRLFINDILNNRGIYANIDVTATA